MARAGIRSSAASESKRMRTLAERYLKYSDSTSRVVAPFDHQGSSAQTIGDDREGIKRHVRKLVREFGERARHVIGRRHDDQRMEAMFDAPNAASASALPSVLSAE